MRCLKGILEIGIWPFSTYHRRSNIELRDTGERSGHFVLGRQVKFWNRGCYVIEAPTRKGR